MQKFGKRNGPVMRQSKAIIDGLSTHAFAFGKALHCLTFMLANDHGGGDMAIRVEKLPKDSSITKYAGRRLTCRKDDRFRLRTSKITMAAASPQQPGSKITKSRGT